MAKYSKTAQKSVESAMHRMKKGKLESGNSDKKVTNPKQAIAIGLSEAREKGAKVPPPKKGAAKKSAPKKTAAKKSAAKKSAAKKSPGKKGTSTKKTGSSGKAKPGPKPGGKKTAAKGSKS